MATRGRPMTNPPHDDVYLRYPSVISASWTPLCSRFIGRDLTCDVQPGISNEGAPLLRVYLASTRHNVRATAIEPVRILRAMLMGDADGAFAEINKKTETLMAELDYQVAAYCASDLWC